MRAGAPSGPFNIARVLCEVPAFLRAFRAPAFRIMPRYVTGTAPTSPREGGLGGDRCRAFFARHFTPVRRGARASFANGVLGGAGPRRAACEAGAVRRAGTDSERPLRAARGSVPRRPRGRTPSVWSPGTTLKRSRPGRAVLAQRGACGFASKRRDGRNEGTVNTASVGTACQGCSSRSARKSASSRSSSSTSAAKAMKSASSFPSPSPTAA